MTRAGILANINIQQAHQKSIEEVPIADAAGKNLVKIDNVRMVENEVTDSRLIPPGGAAIYAVGDRWYGVQLDVIE